MPTVHPPESPPSFADVRLKKPIIVNQRTAVWNVLRHCRGEGPVYVQTPVLVMGASDAMSSRGPGPDRAPTSVELFGSTGSVAHFAGAMRELEDALVRRVAAHTGGRRRVDALTCNDGEVTLRLTSAASVAVFDEAGHDLATWRRGDSCDNEVLRDRRWWDVVAEKQRVTAIFSVEHVWVTGASYGIQYRLQQMRVETLCCSPSLFAHPSLKAVKAVKAVNAVKAVKAVKAEVQAVKNQEVYIRMLKMGVPLQAVRCRMKTDGVPDDTAESWTPSSPMPSSSAPSFLAELSGPAGSVARLRKAQPEPDGPTGVPGVPGVQPEPIGPPKLADILDARCRLRPKSEQRSLPPALPPPLRGLPFLRDIVSRAFRLRVTTSHEVDAEQGG